MSSKNKHDWKPDFNRIPHTLADLDWQETSENLEDNNWFDGDVLLCAVPVCRATPSHARSQHDSKSPYWAYEFAVVTVYSDEDTFHLQLDQEYWGWEWDDMDFFVRIQ